MSAREERNSFMLEASGDQLISLVSMLKMGRCLPSSCSTEDIHVGFSTAFEMAFPNNGLEITPDSCYSEKDIKEIDGPDWAVIILLCLFGLLVILGTCVDMTKKFLSKKFCSSTWFQSLLGFSALSNTMKIFSTSNSPKDVISCINGLRFLSFTWVLIAHGYSFFCQGLPLNNLLDLTKAQGPLFGSPAFQVVLNSFPSVDTFFFIGATLLAYIGLRELDKAKGGNIQFWILYYIHRYIRLTGVYAVVIGITATIIKFLPTGPNHMLFQYDISNCQRDWWTNLAYINNLHWISESPPACMPATWYLANDMQFFLISPLLLYPLWKSPLFGLSATFLWLVVATVLPMVIVSVNDLSLTLSLSMLNVNTNSTYFTNFYIVPWCRFQPYVLGLMFGWLLQKMRNQPKLDMNPFLVAFIWVVVSVLGATIVFGLYPYQKELLETQAVPVGSLAVRIAYNSLHRLGWCICLGWIILACTKGAGGPVNSILSWPFWIPLARISYCMYLVHYQIIAYFTGLPSFSVSFSHLLAAYWILALLFTTVFVAFIVVILVEAPLVQLEKIVFGLLGVGRANKQMKSGQQFDRKSDDFDKK